MQDMDGRKVGLVIACVHDERGATAPGILVRLLVDDALVDQSRTDARGVVVMRLPRGARGRVTVAVPGSPGASRTTTLGPERQHAVVDVEVRALPPSPGARGDDPFERLPADVTPDAMDDLLRLLGDRQDPLFSPGQVGGLLQRDGALLPVVGEGSRLGLPTSRARTVRRFNLVRRSAVDPNRNYLVRMRQEWIFLGHTLGPIASGDDLPPGRMLRELSQQSDRMVQETLDSLERTRDTLTSTLRDTLTQTTSVDTLLDVASRTTMDESVEAWLEGRVGVQGTDGGGYAYGRLGIGAGKHTAVSARATTTTSADTSLETNHLMHTAQQRVQDVVRQVSSWAKDVQTTLNRTIDQVSPLLARVTNLVRWTIAENYAVITRVEDVKEIETIRLFDVGGRTDVFTREDVVELRRVLLPNLLEPLLAPRFEILHQADLAARGLLDEEARPVIPGLPEPATVPVTTTEEETTATEEGGKSTRTTSTILVGPPIKALQGRVKKLVARVHFRADGWRRNADPYDAAVRLRIEGQVAVGAAPLVEDSLQLEILLDPPVGADEALDASIEVWAQPSGRGITDDEARKAEGKRLTHHVQRVDFSTLDLAYETEAGEVARATSRLGDLRTEDGGGVTDARAFPTRALPLRLRVPLVGSKPDERPLAALPDPLVEHVNRNAEHYLGVLLEAAADRPSLRRDAAVLRRLAAESDLSLADDPIWKLPIFGFEGATALVLVDSADEREPALDERPEEEAERLLRAVRAAAGAASAPDPKRLEQDVHALAATLAARRAAKAEPLRQEVRRLLDDPGAATLVQVPSRGVYSEALQGLLELPDLRGLVPAALQPPTYLVPDAYKLLRVGGPGAPAPVDAPPVPGPAPQAPADAAKDAKAPGAGAGLPVPGVKLPVDVPVG